MPNRKTRSKPRCFFFLLLAAAAVIVSGPGCDRPGDGTADATVTIKEPGDTILDPIAATEDGAVPESPPAE